VTRGKFWKQSEQNLLSKRSAQLSRGWSDSATPKSLVLRAFLPAAVARIKKRKFSKLYKRFKKWKKDV